MSKSSLLLLLGGIVLITSFLGIPSSWKTISFSVLGVLIVIVALLLRRDITTGALCLHLTEEKHTDSYKQNGVLRESHKENNHRREKENKSHTQDEITQNETAPEKSDEEHKHY